MAYRTHHHLARPAVPGCWQRYGDLGEASLASIQQYSEYADSIRCAKHRSTIEGRRHISLFNPFVHSVLYKGHLENVDFSAINLRTNGLYKIRTCKWVVYDLFLVVVLGKLLNRI